MITPEKEIEILERISRNKSTIRQRDLARIIGLSLGMTNAILKRLASKGLLQIKKVNNRNIQYIVSAKGMEAITSRSYGYLKRTIKNVVYYKEAIGSIVHEAAERGYQRLILVGPSDLEFIVEHYCHKLQLEYSHVRGRGTAVERNGPDSTDEFLLFSENALPPEPEAERSASLRRLFLSHPRSHT